MAKLSTGMATFLDEFNIKSGNAHFNSEGGSISAPDLLVLLVRNQLNQDKLGIFFHFQNNLVLTSKDEEVRGTDTSPFKINMIKVSVHLY